MMNGGKTVVRKAIVVGGGIGGLTVANALSRVGVSCSVFEQAPSWRPLGFGITLWNPALKVLHQFDLAERLSATAHYPSSSAFRNERGHVLQSFQVHSSPSSASSPPPKDTKADAMMRQLVAEKCPEGALAVLSRPKLHAMLLDSLSSASPAPPRVEVHLGESFVCYQEEPGGEAGEGGVEVSFASGRKERADILIGADGLRSKVRAQMHPNAKLVYAGYTAYRGILPFPLTDDFIGGETWGKGQRFGLLRTDKGEDEKVYWFAVSNEPEGTIDPPGTTKLKLRSIFNNWHSPIPDLLKKTPEEDILKTDLYSLSPLPYCSKGRVVLIGDAAHAMTPNLGYGGCSAIEDAAQLASSLFKYSSSIDGAFADYELHRKDRNRKLQSMSERMGAMASLSSPFASFLREKLFKMTPARFVVQNLSDLLTYQPAVIPVDQRSKQEEELAR